MMLKPFMKKEIKNPVKEGKGRSEMQDNDKRFTGKRNITDNAREEAMGDIEEDADLSIHSPNDDLDEGETARLGEDKTDLV
jgi:hypothetical protein